MKSFGGQEVGNTRLRLRDLSYARVRVHVS